MVKEPVKAGYFLGKTWHLGGVGTGWAPVISMNGGGVCGFSSVQRMICDNKKPTQRWSDRDFKTGGFQNDGFVIVDVLHKGKML